MVFWERKGCWQLQAPACDTGVKEGEEPQDGLRQQSLGSRFHPLGLRGAELHGSTSQVFCALLLDSFRQVV